MEDESNQGSNNYASFVTPHLYSTYLDQHAPDPNSRWQCIKPLKQREYLRMAYGSITHGGGGSSWSWSALVPRARINRNYNLGRKPKASGVVEVVGRFFRELGLMGELDIILP